MIHIIRKSLRFRDSFLYMLLEPVVGYTRIVLATKVGLTVVAAILVLALVVLPLVSPMHKDYKLTFTAVENADDATKNAEKKPTMANPRFQGTDATGQPFNIVASSATQESEHSLKLLDPNGEITLNDGNWISLLAKEGHLTLENKSLDLSGQVDAFHSSGYEFHTQALHVDFKKEMAQSVDPVEVLGPMGSIQANSFKAEQRGKYIVFSGNVKTRLYLQAQGKKSK